MNEVFGVKGEHAPMHYYQRAATRGTSIALRDHCPYFQQGRLSASSHSAEERGRGSSFPTTTMVMTTTRITAMALIKAALPAEVSRPEIQRASSTIGFACSLCDVFVDWPSGALMLPECNREVHDGTGSEVLRRKSVHQSASPGKPEVHPLHRK